MVGIVKYVVVVVVVQYCATTVDLYVWYRVRNHCQSSSAVHRHIVVIRRRRIAEPPAVRSIYRQVGHFTAPIGCQTTQLALSVAVAGAIVAEVRARDDLLAAATSTTTVPDSHGSRSQANGDGPGRRRTFASRSRRVGRYRLLVPRPSAYSITHRSLDVFTP